MAPGLGATACCTEDEESPYLHSGEFLASLSYRYLNSFRDFHGSEEVAFPPPFPSLYADTHIHGFVASLTYQATKRFSMTLEIPFQFGSRTTYYEHDPFLVRRPLELHTMHASGIGDIKLIVNSWLLDPEKHRNGNVSLSLGVKFPSGESNAKDYSQRPTGPVMRPVSQAIQLGDGTWGMVVGIDAFQKLYKNTYAYLQGTYLFTPGDFNGTEDTGADLGRDWTFGERGYKFYSAVDQYVGTAGLGYVIWPKMGVAITIGGRIEGVPAKDLIGNSDGYHIPGYAAYIEPGVSVSKGRWSFAVTVPVAVHRHADHTPADERIAKKFGIDLEENFGYAAFADFLVTASIAVRF